MLTAGNTLAGNVFYCCPGKESRSYLFKIYKKDIEHGILNGEAAKQNTKDNSAGHIRERDCRTVNSPSRKYTKRHKMEENDHVPDSTGSRSIVGRRRAQ